MPHLCEYVGKGGLGVAWPSVCCYAARCREVGSSYLAFRLEEDVMRSKVYPAEVRRAVRVLLDSLLKEARL